MTRPAGYFITLSRPGPPPNLPPRGRGGDFGFGRSQKKCYIASLKIAHPEGVKL